MSPRPPTLKALLQKADQGDDLEIIMSWVNVGEVYYMATRKVDSAKAEEFLQRLRSLPIRLVVPQPHDFIEAARLKATRRISYADAFAAALARTTTADLVTGDPELRNLADVLTIEWIGS